MRVNANAVPRSWMLLAAFGGSYAPACMYMCTLRINTNMSESKCSDNTYFQFFYMYMLMCMLIGRRGVSVTLVTQFDITRLKNIEKHTRKS